MQLMMIADGGLWLSSIQPQPPSHQPAQQQLQAMDESLTHQATDHLFVETHIPDILLQLCWMRPSLPSALECRTTATPSTTTTATTMADDDGENDNQDRQQHLPAADTLYTSITCPPHIVTSDICKFKYVLASNTHTIAL
jgi:hypothetical protein